MYFNHLSEEEGAERDRLASRAVELGLAPDLASRKSHGWLEAFIEVREGERARLEQKLGRAGSQAGATARKNFGV